MLAWITFRSAFVMIVYSVLATKQVLCVTIFIIVDVMRISTVLIALLAINALLTLYTVIVAAVRMQIVLKQGLLAPCVIKMLVFVFNVCVILIVQIFQAHYVIMG